MPCAVCSGVPGLGAVCAGVVFNIVTMWFIGMLCINMTFFLCSVYWCDNVLFEGDQCLDSCGIPKSGWPDTPFTFPACIMLCCVVVMCSLY